MAIATGGEETTNQTIWLSPLWCPMKSLQLQLKEHKIFNWSLRPCQRKRELESVSYQMHSPVRTQQKWVGLHQCHNAFHRCWRPPSNLTSCESTPIALRQWVDDLVQERLNQGIIQPSQSPWVSPIVLVKKMLPQDFVWITENWTVSPEKMYCIVGDFNGGFFACQEPFTKIKTVKFLLATCKASEPHFNPAYTSKYLGVVTPTKACHRVSLW